MSYPMISGTGTNGVVRTNFTDGEGYVRSSGIYHRRGTLTHAPNSLAAKLRNELPTIVRDGSGRPGWIRVRRWDPELGTFTTGPGMHRDCLAVRRHFYRDPSGLLTRPASD